MSTWETEKDENVVSITTGKRSQEKEAAFIISNRSSRTMKWDSKKLDVHCTFRMSESMHKFITDHVEHRSDKAIGSISDFIRDAIEAKIFMETRINGMVTEISRKAAARLEAEQYRVNYRSVEETVTELDEIIKMGPDSYEVARNIIETCLEVERHPILIKKFNKLLRDMEE